MTTEVNCREFGVDPHTGKNVLLYTFTLGGTPCCEVMSLGATVVSLYAPDAHGRIARPNRVQDDVVYGYDNLMPFTAASTPYYGATVGRVANRIAQGDVDLTEFNGPEGHYHLVMNNGTAHHHGGLAKAFSRKVFDGMMTFTEVAGQRCASVEFRTVAEDGEEGYPGKLDVLVKYTLVPVQNSVRLVIDHEARLDGGKKSTVVNMTNHTYWNLAGNEPEDKEKNEFILNHRVALDASYYLPCTEECIPQGSFEPVGPQGKFEEFDFKRDYFAKLQAPLKMDPARTEVPNIINTYGAATFGRRIGESIESGTQQLKWGTGYDHCYAVEKTAECKFVTRDNDPHVKEPTLGAIVLADVNKDLRRYLAVYSTHPGLHFYTGNWNGVCDKGIKNPEVDNYPHAICRKGPEYKPRTSLALEAQVYPDAVHHNNFPSIVLRPNETLHNQIIFEVGSL